MSTFASFAEIIPELQSVWLRYRQMWKSYEIIAALIMVDDEWQLYFCYISGRFESTRPFLDRLEDSVDNVILFYRGIWEPDTFEQFLHDMVQHNSFSLDDGVEVVVDPNTHSELKPYAQDSDFYEPKDFEEALRYILCRITLPRIQNSNILYPIEMLMQGRGYHGLEDMVRREYQLRNNSQQFQISLPLGIRAEVSLEQNILEIHVLSYQVPQEEVPTVSVGTKRSTATPVEMTKGALRQGWEAYDGRMDLDEKQSSVWISHPAFPVAMPGSVDPQILRVDVAVNESRPVDDAAEHELVDLLFRNTNNGKGDGLKQWKQWMEQVDNKDKDRGGHLEIALHARLVYSGARVYNGGTGLGTKGVDLVALWSSEVPPKALVISATTGTDLVKAGAKMYSLMQEREAYQRALNGYMVNFVLAIPVSLDLIPFGAIIEAARNGIAILGKEDLKDLQDLSTPFNEIWDMIMESPKNLHALVTQEFGSANNLYNPFLGS